MIDYPHHFVYGPCWSCGEPFAFHPDLVPSVPVDPATGKIVDIGGVRCPICRSCATAANVGRKQRGLPLWDTSDAAYGPKEGLPE